MTKTEFIDFIDNHTKPLQVFGQIAIDLEIGVFYY
jgi:hypothetical protein